jgi:hypothetical protein
MTVIRRTNPLGKRLALRRVLDRTNQRQEQPARPANDSPRDESDIRPTVDQGSREVGA